MNRKLPVDSFEFYFSLGVKRSYQAVAEKYGVAKKTVAAAATREKWQERIVERERKSLAQMEQKAVETLAAMRDRHLRMLEAMQRKALETLKAMPMQTAYQAVRTLIATIEQEHELRNLPTAESPRTFFEWIALASNGQHKQSGRFSDEISETAVGSDPEENGTGHR